MTTIKEMLANSDIFNGLSDEWLIKIGELARLEDFEEKSYLFVESGEPRDMYIIQSGKVNMDVSLSPTPSVGYQVTVDTLGKGQTCGWSSVMGSHIYTMTAVCTEPVKVIAINGSLLRHFLDDNPDIGYKVMKNTAHVVVGRLRNMKMRLPLAMGRKLR
jgi:CRP-like cAMP-binding protein